MNVYFGQLYIEPGVSFPFSHHFQRYLSKEVTAFVEPSAKFNKDFGGDFELMIRIGAKKRLQDNEVCGPTVFKEDKDVEYTVFLPFKVIKRAADVPRAALQFLFKGIATVFEELGIDGRLLSEHEERIIDHICSNPLMFEDEETVL